jgi:hypothetical protein
MTSIILKSLLFGAVLASTTPVFAETAKPKTTLRYDAKTQLYCLTTEAITGSMISKVLCQSAAKWTAAGLDMPKTPMLAQR